MRVRGTKLGLLLTVAGPLITTVTARAAIVVTSDNQLGAGGTTTFTPTYTVNQPDLLLNLTPTSSTGTFNLETSGGLPVLTDGSYGTINNGTTGSHPAFATGGNNGGTQVIYTLATPAKITAFQVLGGWNDSGRDEQNYNIAYTTTSNSTFQPLSLAGATVTTGSATISGNTIDFNPASVPASTQDATQTTISDNNGAALATGVTAIEFNFGTVENGYTGYAELAAIGTTPEPSVLALGVVCGGGLLMRRRRTI
jgi:hypothetical protein